MTEVFAVGGQVILIDDEDYELVSQYRWYRWKRERNRTAYPRREIALIGGRRSWAYLHHLLIPGEQVDHRNGDGMDNRRANLRACTFSQNRANTAKQRGSYSSRFKGVCWDKSRARWMASIQVDKRHRHLGRFEDETEAARAYDAAAREFFGEFAHLNFAHDMC